MRIFVPPRNNNADETLRAHLVQDIIPYTCIVDPCDTPDEMYLTAESLVTHTLESHSTSCWTCDYCAFETSGSTNSTSHQLLLFETAKDWEIHFLQNHREKLATSNTTILAELSKQQMFQALSCPLCQDFKVDARTMDFKIDDHILRHLQQFSLMSLPESSWKPDQTLGSTSQASVPLSHTRLIDRASAPPLHSLDVEPATTQIQPAITQVWPLLASENNREVPYIVNKPHPLSSTQVEIWKSRADGLMEILEVIINIPQDPSSALFLIVSFVIGWLARGTRALAIQPTRPENLANNIEEHTEALALAPGLSDDELEDPILLRTSGFDLVGTLLGRFVVATFQDPNRHYLPENAIKEVIVQTAIEQELAKIEKSPIEQTAKWDRERRSQLATWIRTKAPKVFAITIQCDFEPSLLLLAMAVFQKLGFTDEKLPIDDKPPSEHVFLPRIWNQLKIVHFRENQWKCLAPVFIQQKYSYDLKAQCIFPFTSDGAQRKDGAFSSVYRVTIHKDHHEYPEIQQVR